MADFEIKLDSGSINQKVANTKTAGEGLELGKLGSYSGSRSEALDEFVAVYDSFSDTLGDYLTLLMDDLSKVSEAVTQMETLDNSLKVDLSAPTGK